MGAQGRMKKTVVIGCALGLVGFIVFGLMAGALVGGTVGLKVAAGLTGAATGMLSRAMAAVGMVMGACVALVMFVSCGWAIGRAAATLAGGADAGARIKGHV